MMLRIVSGVNLFRVILLVLLVIQTPVGRAANETTVVWTGRPFHATIPVGVERVFKFDADRIQVAFPTNLWGIATAESSQGIVFVRSTRPFENVRVRFRNKDTGQIYSVDVSAVAGESDLDPIVVVDGVEGETDLREFGELDDVAAVSTEVAVPDDWEGVFEGESSQVASDSVEDSVVVQQLPVDSQVESAPVFHGVPTLVRYAMQNVYSPERLIEELDDVFRVSFDEEDSRISLVPGANVRSRVLGQWKNEGRYVTAVYLQNMSEETVDLDPRILNGRQYWQIAALMHSVLTPANSFGDSTTLVAISDKKWVEYSQWLH